MKKSSILIILLSGILTLPLTAKQITAILFDVEAIFLYPWAIVFDKIGLYAFIEMVIFIVILLAGYIYAWKKEAFIWD